MKINDKQLMSDFQNSSSGVWFKWYLVR